MLRLRGGLDTSTGKKGSKCISWKKNRFISIDLPWVLRLHGCIFLSDSKWINHLQEDFLQHLLRNSIFFFGRLGCFSRDSAKLSSKNHCLVKPGNVTYRRWEYRCSHLNCSWVGVWLWNVLHLCEVGAKLSSNLLSSWCLMMVLAWAAQEFHSFWSWEETECNWSPCSFKKLWPQ